MNESNIKLRAIALVESMIADCEFSISILETRLSRLLHCGAEDMDIDSMIERAEDNIDQFRARLEAWVYISKQLAD